MNYTDLPDAVRDHARDGFVGNETGTDEYRETQPSKAFTFIGEMMEYFADVAFTDEVLDALGEIRNWLEAIDRTVRNPQSKAWEVSYAGAAELEPVLTRYFNMAWARNKHPYDYPPEEVLRDYTEDQP
jgi:hypothetical protein